MHLLAVGKTKHQDFLAQTHRIDDQYVAFPAADRMAHVRIFEFVLGWMLSSIHPDLPPLEFRLEQDEDALVGVNELYRKWPTHNSRRADPDAVRGSVRVQLPKRRIPGLPSRLCAQLLVEREVSGRQWGRRPFTDLIVSSADYKIAPGVSLLGGQTFVHPNA